MAQGVNGDLADVTLYTDTTPVHYSSSNVPLTELNDNMLVIDQKLEGYMLSGVESVGDSGDGTVTASIAFPATVNSTPRVVATVVDASAAATGSLTVEITTPTTSGFTLKVIASGTGGAWTADVHWFADGR